MYTLITSATSSQAYRFKSELNKPDVILGDYLELPAIMLNNNDMIRLPKPSSIAYAHEMLTLCLDKGIDTVYALRDEEFESLTEAVTLFEEFGIRIVHG
jgi:hypothetical protein